MDFSQEILEEMKKLFERYHIKLDRIKVYGYLVENSVGATADINFLVKRNPKGFIKKYKRGKLISFF